MNFERMCIHVWTYTSLTGMHYSMEANLIFINCNAPPPQIFVIHWFSDLYFHSLVFWLGDLNYRVTDLPIEKVKLLIEDKNYDPLLQHDQVGLCGARLHKMGSALAFI